MKKVILVFVGIAVAGISAYTAHRANSAKDWAEDLLLENAEALAEYESGGGGGSSNSWKCWSKTEKDGGGVWICGNPCVFNPDLKASKSSDGWCYSND